MEDLDVLQGYHKYLLILLLIVYPVIGEAVGLTVDFQWDKNLTNADLVHLKTWALEEYKKLVMEYNRTIAELNYSKDISRRAQLREKAEGILKEIKILKERYINVIDVPPTIVTGRVA